MADSVIRGGGRPSALTPEEARRKHPLLTGLPVEIDAPNDRCRVEGGPWYRLTSPRDFSKSKPVMDGG